MLIGLNLLMDVFSAIDFFTTAIFSTVLIIAHGWISLEIVRIIKNGIDSITKENHPRAPVQPVTLLSSVHYNSGNTNLEVIGISSREQSVH